MNRRTRVLVAGLAASSALLGCARDRGDSEGDAAGPVQEQSALRASMVYYAMPG